MSAKDIFELGEVTVHDLIALPYEELTRWYALALREITEREPEIEKLKDDVEYLQFMASVLEDIRAAKKRDSDFLYYTRHGRFPK